MRATVAINEFRNGLIFGKPRWKVVCNLEFSEEELAIIRQRNLGDLHVYTQRLGFDNAEINIGLKTVVKHGISSVFQTPVDAQNFEHELTQDLLPKLKNYLAASAEVRSGPKTIEF